MLKGLLELAHAAQTAPLPSCSCAKGLAVGVECLASALRGAAAAPGGERGGSSGASTSTSSQAAAAGTAGSAGGAPVSSDALAAAYHSVAADAGGDGGLAPHDAHALRMVLLRSAARGG